MKKLSKIIAIALTSAPLVAVIVTMALLRPIYSMTKEDLVSPYFQFVGWWTSLILPIMVLSVLCAGFGIYLLVKRKP